MLIRNVKCEFSTITVIADIGNALLNASYRFRLHQNLVVKKKWFQPPSLIVLSSEHNVKYAIAYLCSFFFINS
jgi:hypothetical protein